MVEEGGPRRWRLSEPHSVGGYAWAARDRLARPRSALGFRSRLGKRRGAVSQALRPPRPGGSLYVGARRDSMVEAQQAFPFRRGR